MIINAGYTPTHLYNWRRFCCPNFYLYVVKIYNPHQQGALLSLPQVERCCSKWCRQQKHTGETPLSEKEGHEKSTERPAQNVIMWQACLMIPSLPWPCLENKDSQTNAGFYWDVFIRYYFLEIASFSPYRRTVYSWVIGQQQKGGY